MIYVFAIFFAKVFIRLKFFFDTNARENNCVLKDRHLPINNNKGETNSFLPLFSGIFSLISICGCMKN